MSSTERNIGRHKDWLIAWKDWSDQSLKLNKERAKMFKIAKQMRKERKDIVGSQYVRDENVTLKVKKRKLWNGGEVIFLLF